MAVYQNEAELALRQRLSRYDSIVFNVGKSKAAGDWIVPYFLSDGC
jgi:hypothetical protein